MDKSCLIYFEDCITSSYHKTVSNIPSIYSLSKKLPTMCQCLAKEDSVILKYGQSSSDVVNLSVIEMKIQSVDVSRGMSSRDGAEVHHCVTIFVGGPFQAHESTKWAFWIMTTSVKRWDLTLFQIALFFCAKCNSKKWVDTFQLKKKVIFLFFTIQFQ